MENLPLYTSIVFGITVLLTLWFFYRSSRNSRTTLLILASWLILQSAISLTEFYTNTTTIPPKFLLLVIPAMLFIVGLFLTKKGRNYLDNLDLKFLTLLHIVRIPVELVLFWLFVNKAVPELMTFEGRNLDILSRISAPIIYYLYFIRKSIVRNILLVWNIICFGFLMNIVYHAVYSAPFPFQKFAFNQPNIAVLHFPFTLLPGFIVPVVMLSHLAAIRQLIIRKLQ